MSDITPPGTRTYAKDKRAVISGAAAILASASFAVGAWAHAKLWEHDARLSVLETQQRNDGQRQDATQARLDRMDAKLDLILERMPR